MRKTILDDRPQTDALLVDEIQKKFLFLSKSADFIRVHGFQWNLQSSLRTTCPEW